MASTEPAPAAGAAPEHALVTPGLVKGPVSVLAKLPWVVRRLWAANRWAFAVAFRTATGSWRDGFTNAGNLAYLSLLTLFPFLIVVAEVAGRFGRTQDGTHAVALFLAMLPDQVEAVMAQPVGDVLANAGTTSGFLTLSILVMLWTVSGTIETIRAILHHAYATPPGLPFWRTRLLSMLIVVAAAGLMLFGFALQVVLTGAETFVVQLLPRAGAALGWLGIGRLVPAVILLVSLLLIFLSLTPLRYRAHPVWPGAVLTTAIWIGTTMALPLVLANFAAYDRTYGSLAGVIVALLYFYIIGLGLVIGAHFNAALAIVPRLRQNAAVEPLGKTAT